MMNQIRKQFPILNQTVNDEPLIYFDNAATMQKPKSVIDSMVAYYQGYNANIHRGVHTLAQKATDAYEQTRDVIQTFVGAQSSSEILFNSGTTAGINFIARSLVEPILSEGDIILTTILEHHSNLIPWQEVAKRTGTELRFIPLKADFTVDLEQVDNLERIKCVAIHHVSNVLGVMQDIKKISEWAHQRGALLIVDGAQAVAHHRINVQELDVDAYCFSGHKIYGPTGVGVCYLNERHHDTCLPFMYGGEMIHQVDDTSANYKTAPWKFEGGTPPIAQVIGLQSAIKFVKQIGLEHISDRENSLMQRLVEGLMSIDGISVYGADSGIVSFNIEGVHPHDAATGYDMEGIAIRAGHHCAQPLMRHLGIQASLRASIALYNTVEEVLHFIKITRKVKEYFNGIR